VEGLTLTR